MRSAARSWATSVPSSTGLHAAAVDRRSPPAERALEPWIRELAEHDSYVVGWNVAASDRLRRDRVRVTLYLAFTAVAVTRIAWLAASWF